MQTAAVVVGIDKYSKNRLTSAVNDALAFKDALLQHKIVATPQDVILLRTDPQPGDLEPTRDNIIDTLYSFYQNGDQLGRLIFFFAGHAILTFSDAARARTRTVLLPVDVHDLDAHGNRLIDLNEVLDFMRRSGPQEQIFIIDACRDMPWEKHPTVGVTGWTARDTGPERAQATLYAVSEKGKALGLQTGMGIMSSHLIEALNGDGVAKVFDESTSSWAVTAQSLRDYVTRAIKTVLNDSPIFMMPQLHAPDPQVSPIRSVDTVSDEKLVINIHPDESAADTTVAVKLRNLVQDRFSLPPRKNHEVLMLPPSWYRVEATHSLYTPVPAWHNVDLRAVHEIDFVIPIPGQPPEPPSPMRGPHPPSPAPPATAVPAITAPTVAVTGSSVEQPTGQGRVKAKALERQVAIELESLQPPYKSWIGYGELDRLVPVGPYRVRFRLGREVFNESDIYVQNEELDISATTAVTPLLREALSIEAQPPGHTQISESIGDIQAGVLETLLPIVGIKPFDVKDKLFRRFSGLVERRSPEEFNMRPLSLVIAFDGAWPTSVTELIDASSCEIFSSSGKKLDEPLRFGPLVRSNLNVPSSQAPGGMERIGVALSSAPERSFSLVIKLPFKNIRLVSAGLENRASVITLILRPNGSVDVSQNLLRLPGRDELYSDELAPYIPYGQMLRELQLAQQLFKSEELASDRFSETTPYVIQDLFYAKWTDPIMSCMAFYAWRQYSQGRSSENLPFGEEFLKQTSKNLHTYFGELPDAHIVLALAHEDQRDIEINYLLDQNQIPLLAPGLRHLASRVETPNESPIADYASRMEVDQPWTMILEPHINADRSGLVVDRGADRPAQTRSV
jgi:hypothetical protein